MDADPDSRARTHLANERTFLAWFRTGLTLVALGLAAAQFLAPGETGVPLRRTLATVVILTGVFFFAVGVIRYHDNRRRVDEATFRPASRSILIATAGAIIASVVALAFVWATAGG